MRATTGFLRLIGVICLLAGGAAQAADSIHRFAQSEITKTEWQNYLNEIKAKPGAEEFIPADRPDAVAYYVGSDQAVYYFTKGGPAYPAVIIIHPYDRPDGTTKIESVGYYAGSKAGYDAWWQTFAGLGTQMEQRLEGQSGQH